jgi:hypothetical protein
MESKVKEKKEKCENRIFESPPPFKKNSGAKVSNPANVHDWQDWYQQTPHPFVKTSLPNTIFVQLYNK